MTRPRARPSPNSRLLFEGEDCNIYLEVIFQHGGIIVGYESPSRYVTENLTRTGALALAAWLDRQERRSPECRRLTV